MDVDGISRTARDAGRQREMPVDSERSIRDKVLESSKRSKEVKSVSLKFQRSPRLLSWALKQAVKLVQCLCDRVFFQLLFFVSHSLLELVRLI